ncbi:chromosome partitioning protein ParA [Photobacterium aquae]|uniref:Chromosome partitioning protein ParA n=1 Tax=Photobacterium aquae TaxID=1195763 RepID=A0A0J1GWZ0_9GAMM|nr:P-loop NTPase [Photobacterium aquae]KLV04166.1 chromosome partitioning protein ParA [Photobacterium aquae]
MFDLAKAISKNVAPQLPVVNGPKSCTLIYQSQACLALVQEVFVFEGWNPPMVEKEALRSSEFDNSGLNEIIILELNESANVVEDAKRFASQIPTHKGVIIFGKEDAISTLRALKDMGFYYVFWPVTKQELADFLSHVSKNLQTFSGVSNLRKAKRVAVVGSKGGVGTTMLSTEIASVLASDGTDTVLVDHQYEDSNIDVMLSIKGLKRHNITEMTMPLHELDDESAISFLTKVRANLRLLALDGGESDYQLLGFNRTLCQLLGRNTNYIIEDFSASTGFRTDPLSLVEHNDVVVVVIEPSVSSVRNARRLIERIANLQISDTKKLRVLTVLNSHRPDSAFVLSKEEVAEYLTVPIDVYLPFSRSLGRLILEGKRAHKHDRQMQQSLDELVRLINGQRNETKSRVSQLLRMFKR